MNGKWFGTVILAMLVWSATSTGASAQDSRDLGIALEISRQIERYPQFTIFDYVSGTVENGVVTLTGKVTMPFKKNDIARRAGEINGVREVLNRIDVLPVSIYDDQLRRADRPRHLRQLGLLAIPRHGQPADSHHRGAADTSR